MLTFYLVVMTENMVCVVIYFFYGSHAVWLKYAALGSVCGLMVLGEYVLLSLYSLFYFISFLFCVVSVFLSISMTAIPEVLHKTYNSGNMYMLLAPQRLYTFSSLCLALHMEDIIQEKTEKANTMVK